MRQLFIILLLTLSSVAQTWMSSISASPQTNTATVNWNTAVPSTTQVRYGTSTSYGLWSTYYSTLVSSHSSFLSGLIDGTTYHYRPYSKDSSSVNVVGQDRTFTTIKIVVTVSPTSATLTSGATQQFAATVTGTGNKAVTWSSTIGSISSTGLFTAPAVTVQTLGTVRATSVVNAARYGTASITVNPVATSHLVTLNWTASTTSGVSSYNLYRGTISGGPYGLIGNSGSLLTFTDSSIAGGITYFYVARAVESGVESGNSNQATAVIP